MAQAYFATVHLLLPLDVQGDGEAADAISGLLTESGIYENALLDWSYSSDGERYLHARPVEIPDNYDRDAFELHTLAKPHVDYADIADALKTGAASDIWYDADHYGDDATATLIEQTQNAMGVASDVLSRLAKPSVDLLKFIDQMARFTTPEDEFADDPQDYEDADEMVADMDDERLCSEYATFMSMVREARKLAAKARGEVG